MWQPNAARIEASRLHRYQQWLARAQGVHTSDGADLWQWSVDRVDDFWCSIWTHFEVMADGDPSPLLGERAMPRAQWFPNMRLNFAEQVFRHAMTDQAALIARAQGQPARERSWAELQRDVGALAADSRP